MMTFFEWFIGVGGVLTFICYVGAIIGQYAAKDNAEDVKRLRAAEWNAVGFALLLLAAEVAMYLYSRSQT